MAQYQFRSREEAGHILSAHLVHYSGRPDVLVLGLPRGGVPVAAQIAAALLVPLDVLVVGRIGVPGREEITLAAVGPDGVLTPNWEVVTAFGISPATLATHRRPRKPKRSPVASSVFEATAHASKSGDERLSWWMMGSPQHPRFRNAATVLRRMHPARLVVAVPVAARLACRRLADEVDEIVASQMPERLSLVSQYYEEFGLVSDEKIRQLMEGAEHERRVA